MTDRRTVHVVPEEARRYQGRPAGLVSRLVAGTVDAAVSLVIVIGIYLGWSAARFLWQGRKFAFPTPDWSWLIVAFGVVLTVYLGVSWAMTGRTYGAHVLGLRLVARGGGSVHPVRAMLRGVLCAWMPLLLLWAAIDRDRRSVPDLILRTSVIYDWEARAPG